MSVSVYRKGAAIKINSRLGTACARTPPSDLLFLSEAIAGFVPISAVAHTMDEGLAIAEAG